MVHTEGFENVPSLGQCIVQEYIDGDTWDTYFSKNSKKISRATVERLITELCDALQFIHSKQIIHRDIKPENILITHGEPHVRLIDFGLADQSSFDILKEAAGSRDYIAPEVLEGGTATIQSDLYALGILLSKLPYRWSRLKRQTRICLQKDHTKRPKSAKAVSRGIRRIVKPNILAIAIMIALLVAGCILGMTQNVALRATQQHTDTVRIEVPAPLTKEMQAKLNSADSLIKIDEKYRNIRLATQNYARELITRRWQNIDTHFSQYKPYMERSLEEELDFRERYKAYENQVHKQNQGQVFYKIDSVIQLYIPKSDPQYMSIFRDATMIFSRNDYAIEQKYDHLTYTLKRQDGEPDRFSLGAYY